MALGTFPLQFVLSATDKVSPILDKVGGKMGKFGRKSVQTGKALSLGLTVPVLAAGVGIIGTAASFEKEMNRLEAFTDLPRPAIERLAEVSKDLGEKTSKSASQAAQAMNVLAVAGKNTEEELRNITPALVDLAIATDQDMATAADVLLGVMAGFGQESEHAQSTVDKLANAVTKGKVDLISLSEAVKLSGATARSLGQDLDSVLAVTLKLADAQLVGTMGGTTYSQALIKIAQAAKQGNPLLTKFGLTMEDVITPEGTVKNFPDILQKLVDGGITAIETFELLDVRGGRAAVALMNQGVPAITALADKLAESEGKAEKMRKTMEQGAVGAMARFSAKVEKLALVISETGLLDMFTTFVEKLGEVTNKLSQADPRLIKIGLAIAGVVGVIGPLLVGIGLMAQGLGVVMGLLAPLAVAFGAFLLTPLGLISVAIGGLIALGIALIKNWDKVKAVAGIVWSAVKFAISDAVDWAISIVPDWFLDLFRDDSEGVPDEQGRAQARREMEARGRVDSALVGASGRTHVEGGLVFRFEGDQPKGLTIETDLSGSDIPIDIDTGLNLGGVSA